jgi:hypothetical protein
MTGLVMLLLIVIAGLIGVRSLKKMFTEFTDTAPLPTPAVNLSAEEVAQLRKRVDVFRDSVRAKTPTEPLVLTADEINALVANDPDLQPLKGKLYITIEGDVLKGQVSVSMEEAGLPRFKGRYLNGTGTFNIAIKNGMLRINAQTIAVKGKTLPEIYMQKIRTQNLARIINGDPRASVALERLQDIQVKDGKLIIVPKPPE